VRILFLFRSSGNGPGPVAGERWRTRRPVSRVLSPPPRAAGDGHSSGTPVTGRLARPTRTTGPETGLPAVRERRPYLVLLPVGFTVPPPLPAARCALTAPFHPRPQAFGPGGQTALCGTFPGVAPAGRYPAPCFRGARTFLPRVTPGAAIRPPDPCSMSSRPASVSSASNRSRRPSRRASVSRSGTPSTRLGRKCRWNARITQRVPSSSRPLGATP
jgi:hypothetical protein